MNSKQAYKIVCALDGPVLDGMYGLCGVMTLQYYEDDTYNDKPAIRFYDGFAAGHAVQVSAKRNIVHLGGFVRKSLFLKLDSLEPILEMDTTDTNYRLREHWNSPTHVIFAENSEFIDGDFIVVIRGSIYQLRFDDLKDFDVTQLCAKPGDKLIGHLGLSIPHAIKLSHSGRYLFSGAMDSFNEFACKVGIFDLKEKKQIEPVKLDETAWHIQPHPTEDCFYAVSECYDLQREAGDNRFGIRFANNYAWKIWADRRVKKHIISAMLPSHLSSDIVALGDEQDTIIYNSCASSTLTGVQFKNPKTWHIDESSNPKPYAKPKKPSVMRSKWCNFVESLSRLNRIVKALRITRGQTLDGSYGLVHLNFGPGKQRLISAHRGLNSLIVYDFNDPYREDLPIVQTIKLPPVYDYLPWKLGVPKDPRLGLHHCTAIKIS